MSASTLPEGCVIVTRTVEGGTLTFEHFPAGTPTKQGTPRKADWRCYRLDRRRFISTTTLIDAAVPKPALFRWHEDRGAEGATIAYQMGELEGVHPEDSGERVRLLGLGADAAKNRAASRGLDVHTILEDWAREQRIPALADHPVEHRGYVQACARFLIAHRPEPVAVEQITCHQELGYAGRIDLIADIDGRRVVVDYKTSKAIWMEAHIQNVAYQAAERRQGERIDGGLIVRLGEDGTFEAVECRATDEQWHALVGWYEALRDLKRAI